MGIHADWDEAGKLYTRTDVSTAYDEGFREGNRTGIDKNERFGYILMVLGLAVVGAIIVGVTYLHLNDPPGHKWVDVDGRTCVQIPHPDFSSTSELTPEFVVFCQRNTPE